MKGGDSYGFSGWGEFPQLRKLAGMRLLPLLLVGALVIPAPAVARSKHYFATVSPSGSLSFKVSQKRQSKEKAVTSFSYADLPVTCSGFPHTTWGDVAGGDVARAGRVRKGRFNLRTPVLGTASAAEFQGNLAAGTIRVAGELLIDASTKTGFDCDTGTLAWTVRSVSVRPR
jgi:hypothetical protein